MLEDNTLLKSESQKGWILLEVMGSCLLLSVILMALQSQIREQWSAVDSEFDRQRAHQKTSELLIMRAMLQDQTWLIEAEVKAKENFSDQGINHDISRPNCHRCSGVELEQWFNSRY